MEPTHLTVETIEDFLLEFLNITQENFASDGFPLDSKSKWLDFKQANLQSQTGNVIKKQHFTSKSQNGTSLKWNFSHSNTLNERSDMNEFVNQTKPALSYVNFTNEFKVLLKNVNDNTRFYENLAFKQNEDEKFVRREIIDPLTYYTRSDMYIKDKK